MYLQHGTTLEVAAGKSVHLDDGEFYTVAKDGNRLQPEAVIKGKMVAAGSSIAITFENGDQTGQYGTLKVEGKVDWFGGKYIPSVDPAAGQTTSDLWHATGAFSVFPTTTSVNPIGDAFLDNTYTVLKSGFAINPVVANPGERPEIDVTDWVWVGADGTTEWKLRRAQRA